MLTAKLKTQNPTQPSIPDKENLINKNLNTWKINETDKKIKINSIPPKPLIKPSENTQVLTENKQTQNQKSDEETLDWTKNLTKLEKNSFLKELTSNYQRFKQTHQTKKPNSLPPSRPSSQHPHPLPPPASSLPHHINTPPFPPSSSSSIPPPSINPPPSSSFRPSSSSIPSPSFSSMIPSSIPIHHPSSFIPPLPSFPPSPSKIPTPPSSSYMEDDVERSVEKQFSKVDKILDAILKVGEENKRSKSEMRNKGDKEKELVENLKKIDKNRRKILQKVFQIK